MQEIFVRRVVCTCGERTIPGILRLTGEVLRLDSRRACHTTNHIVKSSTCATNPAFSRTLRSRNSHQNHQRLSSLSPKFYYFSNFINFCQKRDLSFRRSVNLRRIMCEKEDWLDVGSYRVYPWSVSGLDTSVVVRGPDLCVAFDMGYPTRESTKCPHVFISHGHVDHVSGLVQHAARRELYSMKPATYYLPPHLIPGVRQVAQGIMSMHENLDSLKDLRLHPLDIGDSLSLPHGWTVKVFPTKHRVHSQGYILYKQTKKLKQEFMGLPSREIAKLIHSGEEVHDIQNSPQVAYTGDTMFDIFQAPHNQDLLKVKVLITESTYIDDDLDSQGRNNVQKARDRGHIHLREFTENAWLFREVDNIVLIHFSDKYSVDYIHETVDRCLPTTLRQKVHLGTLSKDKFG